MRMTNKTLSKYYLLIVLLTTVVTAGMDLYSYKEVDYGTLYIQRQFGNEIKFNMLFIVILLGTIFALCMKKRKKEKDIFKWLLLFCAASLLFQNGKDLHLAIIGIVSIIKYYLLYYSLLKIYDLDKLKKYLKKALIVILIIESIGGFLQTFLRITIPFLTSRNVKSYRGSMMRMTGTMNFSADFALVISFITIFFLCDYFIKKNKRSLIYILLCMFDLWFSGSRTMIIATYGIFIFHYMKKNKHKPINNVFIIAVISVFLVIFINSNKFIEYFVSDNILSMFSTRFVHWRMGFEMIVQHPLLGVGLNNSVLYANRNPDIVRNAYTFAVEPISFYFTNPIHNSIIIMFVELGIIGGALYLLLFIGPVFKCIKRNKVGEKFDVFFIISESAVLIIYALQGWGSLREHGMVLMVIFYTYFKLVQENYKNKASVREVYV